MTKKATVVIERARARQQIRSAPAAARALREQAGLTQADVADVLGVSPAAVSRWETGQRLPGGARAVAYLDLLRAVCGARR